MVQTNDLNAAESPSEPRPRGGPGKQRPGARVRLIEAGRKLFAESGFTAVSTRALAQAAGVNLSAITYHFGGKGGLYEAVIRDFLDEVAAHRHRLIDWLDAAVATAGGDRRRIAAVAADFVRGFFAMLLSPDFLNDRAQIMLRELHNPSAAFDIIMREHIGPIHDALANLAAAARGCSAEEPEIKLLTHAAIGQLLAFGFARPVVLARMGWQHYTPERLDQVAAAVAPAFLAALGLDPGQAGGGGRRQG